jgi:hypothetical protein
MRDQDGGARAIPVPQVPRKHITAAQFLHFLHFADSSLATSAITSLNLVQTRKHINMTEGNGNGSQPTVGTIRVKQGLAQMLKGGVIVSLFS